MKNISVQFIFIMILLASSAQAGFKRVQMTVFGMD
jgi:hypothetical protein